MSYRPGDPYCREFTTNNPGTGAAQDADTLPSAIANRNGADDLSFGLAVSKLDTGRYKLAGTIPNGYSIGDIINITVAATVATIAGKAAVDSFVLDRRVGDLNDYAGGDTPGTTALLSRLTAARGNYLDNLNIGGPVASHADILAINQSASRTMLLQTVGQYESPVSGSEAYTVELRTFSAKDGSAVDADSSPTLTATGGVSGDLSASLSAVNHVSTGLYRWTYTVGAAATQEQIRFDATAIITAKTYTLSAYTQVVDEAGAAWNATDAGHLTAIYNKLPSNNLADQTLLTASIAAPLTVGTNQDKAGYGLNLAQTIPRNNTADTLGDALHAARVQGFGAWAIVGTNLLLYESDGITPARVFVLDNPTAASKRT